jgi:hypothetical protein
VVEDGHFDWGEIGREAPKQMLDAIDVRPSLKLRVVVVAGILTTDLLATRVENEVKT